MADKFDRSGPLDKTRDGLLRKAIVKGEKEIKAVVKRNQRTIKGLVSEYSEKPRFATNAALRTALYRELAGEYKKFGSDIDEWTRNNVESTAQEFWKFAKTDLPLEGTFGAFSKQHIEDILGEINPNTVDDLVGINAAAGGMLQNDVRALRAAVATTIAEGAVEGLTNPQLAERMRIKVGDAAGKFQFVDRSGRKWKADNYFGMLNRTIHAQAARNTYATAGTSAGYDLYTITGGVTGSSVENPDDPCDAWAGRIFSMTGSTEGFPTYDDALSAGVFHPNCVHGIRAVLPSEVPELQAKQKVKASVLA